MQPLAWSRRVFIVSICSVLNGCQTNHAPEVPADLLTMEQYALIEAEGGVASRGAASAPVEETVAQGGPRIVVEQPDLARPLVSPVRVEVRFKPMPEAPVVPESFTVRYKKGFLSLDITEQALQFMHVTEDGASGSEIPIRKVGIHTLVIEVSDTERRTGRQTLTFEIAGSR